MITGTWIANNGKVMDEIKNLKTEAEQIAKIEALLKAGLIADGAMLGNRVTMVLTLKGEVALNAEPR